MRLPRHASPEQDRHETSSRKREECHLPQWCPEGLSKSQKQRVQRLRCLEQAEENYLRLLKQVSSGLTAISPPRREKNLVCRRVQPKSSAAIAETSADPTARPSAVVNMVFFLPDEFRNP